MMNAHKMKISAIPSSIDMESIWAESMSDTDFSFDIKAQSVSTDLVRAVSELGFSQSDIAQKLGWSPSRVSRVLHGSANLTLRTLHEFASALDLEFDVIYRQNNQNRPPQPWESTVMIENAAVVCQKIEDLHVAAKDNLSRSESILGRSESILETARSLNRRAWNPTRACDTIQNVMNVNVAYG